MHFCYKPQLQIGNHAAGVVLSMLRFGPKLALTGLQAPTLTAPFAKVVDQVVTDPWLRTFLDLECFVLRYSFPVVAAFCAARYTFLQRQQQGKHVSCLPVPYSS